MRTRLLAIISTATLLSFCATLVAQKIDGYYVSRRESNSTIYFLRPQELFANKELGKFKYDLTVIRGASSDSVRMNFSYYAPQATPIDSIRISSASVNIGGECQRIYIEPTDKVWTHRYTIASKLEQYLPLYNADAPPTITIYSGGEPMIYSSNKNEWQRYAPIGLRIFAMIKVN